MLDNYVIAKYIRLSLEDSKSDSMSVENQRLLLDSFIADMDCEATPVLEFVDNGFSGTNYERPGVQELLELVREGKVNCVIVKDFSRFGRNAIETGYFIERVFPFYRVRFISVDDGFDSLDHEGDTGGLEVSFKFLMHEYYSRDLSKKITTAKRVKMHNGEAVSKNCPYGYVLDDKRNMVIDPVAADTVQFIFNMYIQGKSLADIEKLLYEARVSTPAAYKKYKRVTAQDERFACVWQKSVVLKILRDEQYTGVYVAGKTIAKDPVTHSRIKAPKESWVRIPDHHPAIVSLALFNAAQESLRVKGDPIRKRRLDTAKRYAGCDDSPLKGKVICGHCGHSLRISCTKNAAFHCWFTRSAPDVPCHKLRAPKLELEEAIFAMIARQADIVLNLENADGFVPYEVEAQKKGDCKARIENCYSRKRGLYERLILGEIDVDAYMDGKLVVERELDRLEDVYSAIGDPSERQTADEKAQKIAQSVKEADGLTPEVADLLIDKILLYPGDRLEVYWKISAFDSTSTYRGEKKNAR